MNTQAKEIALLAGGCFWGVEELFRRLEGVLRTEVGYTGGTLPNPTYENVKTGKTGHAEAIRIEFDPQALDFADLLRYFFRLHDPTTLNRQGNDVGSQYRSAIFYQSEVQKITAQKVISEFEAIKFWKNPIRTEISEATEFFSAEEFHQRYLQKNPGGYTCHFVRNSAERSEAL